MALIHEATQNYQEAIDTLERALQLDQENVQIQTKIK